MQETYLFFGSFNPIHKGHLSLVRYILSNTVSDIWIIVSPQNPHKDPKILAPFTDRYNMVRGDVEEYGDRVKVSDIEELMPKPSYTINTVKKLISQYPDRKFCLLCGSDIADTIHLWYKYDQLKDLIDIRIYPRKESERGKCSEDLMNAPVLECSSTDFREKKDISLLSESTIHYIESHNLYR